MESCHALLQCTGRIYQCDYFVSHDEDILHRLANKLVVFDGGVRTYELPYGVFLEEIGWKEEEEITFPKNKATQKTIGKHSKTTSKKS